MKRTVLTRYLLGLPLGCTLLAPLGAAPSPTEEVMPLDSPLLRVGLARFGGAAALTVRAVPGARLVGPAGREKASGAGGWTFAVRGGGVEASDARGRYLGAARLGQSRRRRPGPRHSLRVTPGLGRPID